MISPEDILAKAERRYRDVLKTWLVEGSTESLFPMPIRFRHIRADDNSTQAAAVVQALRAASKDETGSGFSILWKTIKSKTHGRNDFPDRITFETNADYLDAVGKTKEFMAFTRSVSRIRKTLPQLEPWLQREIVRTRRIADEELTEGLIEVCRYLVEHPRCGLFARELPVSVDTKFIERHATDFLRPWLDLVLSPDHIRADEEHFARRFGLGYAEPLIRVRFLDDSLRRKLKLTWNDFALPLSMVSKAINPEGKKLNVFIVENLVTALTLPAFPNGLVIGGLGNGAHVFRDLSWLSTPEKIRYWGDIDSEGFEILSGMRRWFPQIQSFLMDKETLDHFLEFQVSGNKPRSALPENLTPEESELSELCRAQSIRLEQEKISQDWVLERMANIK